ncbi:MAG: Holliday junction resolvase RuvX [Actinomycetota bacterium]|nr:Holliday junction resolvase RuvX [Actinomycetota bacterium]
MTAVGANDPAAGRVLGVDLGARRIGLAVSDPTGTIASPYAVLQRSGDAAADHRRMAEIAAEVGAQRVVVGLPLALSGRVGRAAEEAMAEVEEMARVLHLPVEAHDERLTTVSAERSMRALGSKGADRRRAVDKVAAALMLQSWLDGRRR